jgi:hypothetical protein
MGPDYAGTRKPDGTFDKAYLAMLSVNYCAALDRMIELCKLTSNAEKQREYERRREVTRKSLSHLLMPEGYFLKFIETNGTKHGVVGQKPFGYFCAWANVDAAALRVVDDAGAARIYQQIAALPGLRPFDFIVTNWPSLDDTYMNWGSGKLGGIDEFGCWVNGGVWGTLEGRAILMYYRLRKFEDVRRSAARMMKWAKDFRFDDHFTQCGENSNNLWYDNPADKNGVAITIDNFAIPAGTIRGLFDYEYRSDRLLLRPRIPATITVYRQKHPVRFGEKTLYLCCHNAGPKIKSVTVNGKPLSMDLPDAVTLVYDSLPKEATVEIVTEGGWGVESPARTAVAGTPVGVGQRADKPNASELSSPLKKPYSVLRTFERHLAQLPYAQFELAFVHETLAAIEAWRQRTAVDPGPGHFRPMTPQKQKAILKLYEDAALAMYNGLAKRMAGYAKSSKAEEKRLAELFQRAQGD